MFLLLLMMFLLFVISGLGTRLVVGSFDGLVGGLPNRLRATATIVLVSLSSSLPELFIALTAGVAGRPEISLANLLGANVVNLSLVIGGATLAAGVLPIVGDYWRYELAAVFLAGLAPILLLMDGGLSRLDGLILVVIYLLYLEGVVVDGHKCKSLIEESILRRGIISRIKLLGKRDKGGDWLKMLSGVGLMALGAWGVVKLTVELAPRLQVSTVVLGIVLVSLGTCLPELWWSVRAAVRREAALILGNLFGTIATNATLIVGLLALIKPFMVGEMGSYSLVNLGFVLIFGCFWLFTSTKKRLDRYEGLILVGLFVTFVGLELLLRG